MFLDASVVVAIITREPGWEEILKRLESGTGALFVSPMVRFEATLALARKRSASGSPKKKLASSIAAAGAAVNEFLSAVEVEEISVTPEIGSIALEAARTYGKVVGHPADLNFGDCFAYACAKSLNAALVYKGGDFAQTDLA